jgi:hypothetical protein
VGRRWSEDVATLGPYIDPWKYAGSVADTALWGSEVEVPPTAASQDFDGIRQPAVLPFQLSQRLVPAFIGVDIKHKTRGAGPDSDVGLRLALPPPAYLAEVGRGVFETILRPRVLACGSTF